MANVTLKVAGNNVDLATLSAEKQAALAAILGEGVTVEVVKPKVSMGKLEGKIDSEGNYICQCCGKTHNYNELDDEAKAKARKFGVCPNCQKVYDFMNANKSSGAIRVKNAVSAGELCRAAILPHIDEIDEEKLALLTDLDNCKTNMKLRYPLFIELPAGASKMDKNEIRKPDGKNARFAAEEYQILGRTFLMCNDLYSRNVAPIEEYMKVLFGANEEIAD